MPLYACGGNGSREFILVFVTTLIEEMYLVGGGDGDGGIDGHVGNCYPDDPLVIVLEVFYFCFGEETHQSNYI